MALGHSDSLRLSLRRLLPRTFAAASLLLFAACGGGGSASASASSDSSAGGKITTYALTVKLSGSGIVTSTPAGIDCGSDCTERYVRGTSVTLTATPASGYVFVGWSGRYISCPGTGPCVVTMSGGRTVTATFRQAVTTYPLSVRIVGSGRVSSAPAGIDCGSDCSESYVSGTSVTLTAAPASGFSFTGWSGSGISCPGTGTCTIAMNAEHSADATFTAVAGGDTTRVSVSGFGYVASADKSLSCGSVPSGTDASSTQCAVRFADGTASFTATPYNASFRFAGWRGACTGTGTTCTLDVSTGQTFGALFVPVQPTTDVCLAQDLKSDTTVYPLDGHFPSLAIGQAFTDPKFGTTIRRVTDVKNDGRGNNNVLKTVYSTISAWNADESYLFVYRTDGDAATHELYNGKTYQFLRKLDDINPVDLEQVYWDTNDPDILYYANRTNNNLYRYHVSTRASELIRNFNTQCGTLELHGGSDPLFNAWDSKKFGFACTPNGVLFSYDLASNAIGLPLAGMALDYGAPQAAPSGTRFLLNENNGNSDGRTATVRDADMKVLRYLDLASGNEHGGLSLLSNGDDTWNAVAFDTGPAGSGIGTLVQHNMATGAARVIVGPDRGYPYPPSGTHVGSTAFHRTGLVAVSIKDDLQGDSLLDNELLLVDTDPATNPAGSVCRVGHHRTVSDDYWAEPHPAISPSGTRILFSSSWGDARNSGEVVNVYVVELPGYRP